MSSAVGLGADGISAEGTAAHLAFGTGTSGAVPGDVAGLPV